MTTRETVGEVFCDAIAAGELSSGPKDRADVEFMPAYARERLANRCARAILEELTEGVLMAGSPEDFLRILQQKTAESCEKLPRVPSRSTISGENTENSPGPSLNQIDSPGASK